MRYSHIVFVTTLILCAIPGKPQGFSPDGKQIAFAWPTGVGRTALATVGADGAGFRTVAGDAVGQYVAWSPTGQSVLYTVGGAAPSTQLLDANTGQSREMTRDLTGPYAWREDCARYVGVDRSVPGEIALLECSADDGSLTLRIPIPGVGPGFAIADIIWLPNTDDLAFIGVQGASRDIYLAEAGEVTKVTTSVDVIGIGLSADRSKLVWARESKNTRYILTSVYTFDLSKRSSERLALPERVALINPDPHNAPKRANRALFSPDGLRLALLSTFDGTVDKKSKKPTTDFACYTMGLDGADAKLVYKAANVGDAFNAATLKLAWSPDSKQIAYVGPNTFAVTDPQWCVKLINADDAGAKNVH